MRLRSYLAWGFAAGLLLTVPGILPVASAAGDGDEPGTAEATLERDYEIRPWEPWWAPGLPMEATLERDYEIRPLYRSYPGMFYGRIFTHRKTGAKGYLILASDHRMYPVAREAKTVLGKDPGWIRELFTGFMGCPAAEMIRETGEAGDPDECDEYCCLGECVDTLTFSRCAAEGANYDGAAAFGDSMGYTLTAFDSRIPEQDRVQILSYDRDMPAVILPSQGEDFVPSFCVQDCPSDDIPEEWAGREILEAGFLLYPTFDYPLTGRLLTARTYVRPGREDMLGYMIYRDVDVDAEKSSVPDKMKEFCGSGVTIREGKEQMDFSGCLSHVRGRGVEISGKLEGRENCRLLTFWSSDLPAADQQLPRREAEQRLSLCRP